METDEVSTKIFKDGKNFFTQTTGTKCKSFSSVVLNEHEFGCARKSTIYC